MNTNLYAQTGHFATPKEAAIFMVLVVIVVLAAAGKTIFS